MFNARFAVSGALLSSLALLVGCAQTTADDGTASTNSADTIFGGATRDTSSGVSQGVGAAAPSSAATGGGYTEIARGYVTQLKNFPTYNNPTGGGLKVHVTGCQLAQLSVSVLSSNGAPIGPIFPAGSVANFDGSYDMYWAFPAQNLGYATLWAWANDARLCYATIEQTGDGGSTPPPPPRSCAGLNEFACITTPTCVADYQYVSLPTFPPMISRVFAQCRPVSFGL